MIMAERKYTPQECHFGISENYWTIEDRPGALGVFISFKEEGGYAYDNMYNDLLTEVPDWLPDATDMECYWEVPEGIDRAQVMRDMTALGYTHEPKWDGDMA